MGDCLQPDGSFQDSSSWIDTVIYLKDWLITEEEGIMEEAERELAGLVYAEISQGPAWTFPGANNELEDGHGETNGAF